MSFVRVASVQRVTARKFKVPVDIMTAALNRGIGKDGRNAFRHSRPRQVAIYIASKLTGKSTPQLGRLFGGRHHSTIIHAIRSVEERIRHDRVLRVRIKAIQKVVRASIPVAPIYIEPPKIEKPAPAPRSKRNWKAAEMESRKCINSTYSEMMRSVTYEPKVREEDRVRRDPCIKCGTRSDIGCIHTRVAA